MLFVLLTVALAVPAPVSSVTVYSGQARVVRTARVQLRDAELVEWPVLPGRLDPQSIRLEVAAGAAEIAHVTLRRLTAAELPAGATTAADPLADLDERIAARGREQAVFERLAGVSGWKPERSDEATSAPLRLDPRGWRRGLAFLETFAAGMHQRAREAQREVEDLRARRQRLAVEARAGGGAPAGWKVVAMVTGRGPAELRLAYLVDGARWTPQYEVRLNAAQDRATLALSGVVSQQTGEDWPDTALILSTAMPTVVTSWPRPSAWRLGERDRFVPAPSRRPSSDVSETIAAEDPTVVTGAPSIVNAAGPPDTSAPQGTAAPDTSPAPGTLRVWVFDQTGTPLRGVKVTVSPAPGGRAVTYTNDEGLCRFTGLPAGRYQLTASAPKLRTVVQSDLLVGAQGAEANLVMETEDRVEEVMVVERAPVVATRTSSPLRALDLQVPGGFGPRESDSRGFSFLVDPGPRHRRPALGTAAALSGGYEVAFAGPGLETIRSGEQRRVPLQSWTWPVNVERALYPGLGPDGYLQAQLTFTETRALPGGRASIFAGDDPVGSASLPPVAPGGAFTLPLGVDRAIRPVRRETIDTRPAGLFGGDEVDRHLVTIEITNPHAQPARVRVHDQIPVSGDPRLRVTMPRAPAGATLDQPSGTLRWDLKLAAGSSTTLTFTYEIRRPRAQRLDQVVP